MQSAARLTIVVLAFTTLGALRAAAAGLLPATPMLPPMRVTVAASPDVPDPVISMMLAEADAIWRRAGCGFVWERGPIDPPPTSARPWSSLRVVIGDRQRTTADGTLPLGWIVFDDVSTPEQEVYVSYASARRFLDEAAGVVGRTNQMPVLQRQMLMARAMGRVLAHELGHYLLASKAHTARGIMKATQTATELFSNDRSLFTLEPSQAIRVAARLAMLQPPLAEVTPRYRPGV